VYEHEWTLNEHGEPIHSQFMQDDGVNNIDINEHDKQTQKEIMWKIIWF
jgi:hypothetical protein